VSYKEKRKLVEKQATLPKKVEYLRQILRGLILMKRNHIHHGSLHPGNVLLSAQNEVKLDDIGYAFIIPYDYSGTNYEQYFKKNIDVSKLSDDEKEQYDIYSFCQLCQTYLADVLDEFFKNKLDTILANALKEGKDLEGFIELLNSSKEFDLSGEVDYFWNSCIEVNRIEWMEFIDSFYNYFKSDSENDSEKHHYIMTELSNNYTKTCTDKDVWKYLALKHLLQVEIEKKNC